ncbi:hypothetical protein EMCG_08140 [[Emmonsia] crescens]|uniref:Uncharacterized protein n=1 Tax=[Emmonsia] crescens TaxID=73230 RepID=A0A0G2I6K4_9EURO|nr:hypothetical protein EMCG_08140 [Emmonsia crescens UAMH 3008]
MSITVNLAFLSPELHNLMISCKVKPGADMASDHQSIVITVELEAPYYSKQRCSWRHACTEKIEQECQALKMPGALISRNQVDDYTEYLVNFVEEIAARHAKIMNHSVTCQAPQR